MSDKDVIELLKKAQRFLAEADRHPPEKVVEVCEIVGEMHASVAHKMARPAWTNFRERRPGFICEVLVYWQLLQMDRAILTVMQYRPDRDVWISRSGHEYGSDEYIAFLFWQPLPAAPSAEMIERVKKEGKG